MEKRFAVVLFITVVAAAFANAANQNNSGVPSLPSFFSLPSVPIPSTMPAVIQPTELTIPTTTTASTLQSEASYGTTVGAPQSGASYGTTVGPSYGTTASSSETSIAAGTGESSASSGVTTQRPVTTVGPAYGTTLPMQQPGRQSTTTTTVCGGDSTVCYVDLAMTQGEKPDCCTPQNNPTCAQCFTPCRIKCDLAGEGVAYCFGSDISFGCTCTKGRKATCYQAYTTTTSTTTTLYLGIVKSAMEDKPLFYLIFLVLMVVLLAFIMYYVRSL